MALPFVTVQNFTFLCDCCCEAFEETCCPVPPPVNMVARVSSDCPAIDGLVIPLEATTDLLFQPCAKALWFGQVDLNEAPPPGCGCGRWLFSVLLYCCGPAIPVLECPGVPPCVVCVVPEECDGQPEFCTPPPPGQRPNWILTAGAGNEEECSCFVPEPPPECEIVEDLEWDCDTHTWIKTGTMSVVVGCDGLPCEVLCECAEYTITVTPT